MRWRTSRETLAPGVNARDTAERETPARFATSAAVTKALRKVCPLTLASCPSCTRVQPILRLFCTRVQAGRPLLASERDPACFTAATTAAYGGFAELRESAKGDAMTSTRKYLQIGAILIALALVVAA